MATLVCMDRNGLLTSFLVLLMNFSGPFLISKAQPSQGNQPSRSGGTFLLSRLRILWNMRSSVSPVNNIIDHHMSLKYSRSIGINIIIQFCDLGFCDLGKVVSCPAAASPAQMARARWEGGVLRA